ncbi:hypothetical protein K488DRAFT_81577 [Vararia minispora EC-137]|uniref:Uncharacterized protein n=1 Tax=Vararia minispora EC-137 TaxID=1314806 RepID=A0ACB8QYZ8_9AGAM|nr:hypothetical protein K488DRAFT_81577 [Vararia minispora EC-137]
MTVNTTVLIQKMSHPARHRQAPVESPIPPSPSDVPASDPRPSPPSHTSAPSSDSLRKHLTPEDYYRAFDRHFAARYFQLADAHRKRVSAVASGTLPLLKPRHAYNACQSSFLNSHWCRMQIYSPPTATYVTALFELPGMKNSDITVNVTRDGKLTVCGERKAPSILADPEHRDIHFPVQEIKYGRFERSLNIPPGVEVSPYPCASSMSLHRSTDDPCGSSQQNHPVPLNMRHPHAVPEPAYAIQYISDLFPSLLPRFLQLADSTSSPLVPTHNCQLE